MVDTSDSKSDAVTRVPVRVRPPVPFSQCFDNTRHTYSHCPRTVTLAAMKMPIALLPAYPVLLILLTAGAGHADEKADNKLEHIVISATQQASAARRLPLSVAVVDADDLDTVQAIHANELLQRVAGAWLVRGNGQESLISLRSPVLTGAGSCGAFVMASDGIALRAPGFCNVNQLFDANIEQAARIEVIKGPGTALYGSGAMHGLINVISPRPAPEPQHHIALERGPHDYLRGKYLYSRSRGRHGWLLAANASDDDGYQREAGYQQQKLTLRHRFQGTHFSSDTLFGATRLEQETAGFIQGHEAYKVEGRKRENPNPEAFRQADSQRVQSTVSLPFDNGNKLTITPYWRTNDMEFLQHFVPWQALEANGHESYGLSAKFYRPTTRLQWVSGVDVELTEGWLRETQALPFSPNQPQGVHYDYRVDALLAAAWVQLDRDFARHGNISLGGRLETSRYDYNNRSDDGPACAAGASACRFYRPADRRDDFTDRSLNIGLLYHVHPAHTLWLRFAQGFRAPQATELYRLQAGQERAELESEQLDSLELGLRGGGARWRYELAAYAMEKDQVIFQDANRRNVSGARTRHHGLEFTLRWQLVPRLELAIDGTLARHEYNSDIALLGAGGDLKGKRIDSAPQQFGSLRLGWDLHSRYRAELEWTHMGRYYLEPDNRHVYDGHDVLKLRLLADFNEQWHGAVRITNLSDTDYAERADFGFGHYRYFVGEPRAVYLQLEYRFKQPDNSE